MTTTRDELIMYATERGWRWDTMAPQPWLFLRDATGRRMEILFTASGRIQRAHLFTPGERYRQILGGKQYVKAALIS